MSILCIELAAAVEQLEGKDEKKTMEKSCSFLH